ncbi:hypothetical protein [Leptospira interrogans]|uniref:hypothetical protein n=1 Tax=Leptospira interrogans TaxID=173 RepID=UPI0009E2349A|nr:hypothetical protein [Leptospira interrogans]
MALKLSVSLSTDRSTDRVWNSAERFPMGPRLELSRTLSYGSRSRLKLKAKYHITFLSYNLLTKTENAAGFIQAFLL